MKRKPITLKPRTMTEVLRQALIDSELPLLVLQRETGLKRASLRWFINGERSLRLDMADKLASYFGLELGPASEPKQKGVK